VEELFQKVVRVTSSGNAPVSQIGAAIKTPENGAVSGAEVPVLVPFSFPRIVTVFPFLHS
jgi:hypothetical protein